MRIGLKAGLMAGLCLLWAGLGVTGMSSTNYSIPNDVMSGGGGDMSSTNYQMVSTLGQSSPLGTATSVNYVNYPGFWQADECVYDADGDGLTNCDEYGYDTNPYLSDTDGDTLGDGEEVTGGVDGYTTEPLIADTDGDLLRDWLEYQAGTNPKNPDTEGDGLQDGLEVSLLLDPLFWDSDHDALPDKYEYDQVNLNPADPLDADVDFDGDSIENVHEYYNGTDPFDAVNKNPRCGEGCFCWGESGISPDGILDPTNLADLQKKIIKSAVSYAGVIPSNGLSQDMTADTIMDPIDLSIVQKMLLKTDQAAVNARPSSLTVVDQPSGSVYVGDTCEVVLEVNNQGLTRSPSFGVVFEVTGGTGLASLLGGQGLYKQNVRYDVSETMAGNRGRVRLVLLIEQAGDVQLDVSLPGCGVGNVGKSCPTLDLPGPIVITGVDRP